MEGDRVGPSEQEGLPRSSGGSQGIGHGGSGTPTRVLAENEHGDSRLVPWSPAMRQALPRDHRPTELPYGEDIAEVGVLPPGWAGMPSRAGSQLPVLGSEQGNVCLVKAGCLLWVLRHEGTTRGRGWPSSGGWVAWWAGGGGGGGGGGVGGGGGWGGGGGGVFGGGWVFLFFFFLFGGGGGAGGEGGLTLCGE